MRGLWTMLAQARGLWATLAVTLAGIVIAKDLVIYVSPPEERAAKKPELE